MSYYMIMNIFIALLKQGYFKYMLIFLEIYISYDLYLYY